MASGRTDHGVHTPLLHEDRDDDSTLGPASSIASITVPDGFKQRDITLYVSFASAILSCLCAGSLTAFSLYGHLFQEHLRYNQLQVNAVSIAAELAMYLPVPFAGYLCDRIGPGKLSFSSAILFGAGYMLAAFTYRSGTQRLREMNGDRGWPFSIMIVAFVAIGMATCCMYLSAVTTCAKNFGRGRYRGLALACPIAAFGLSGMWLSQIGSRVLYEKKLDGTTGDVDVFKFFMFLAVLLLIVGLLGTVGLRIVDEEELIDEAFDELEASGLLEGSAFFQRHDDGRGYGSFPVDQERLESDSASAGARPEASDRKAREEEEARKKTALLNEETKMFLKDHTMWWFAAGFFLVTGPGEAYINNVGTIIGTLYPPTTDPSVIPTTAASHISIIALTSTIARLSTGTLTDILAPSPASHHYGGSTTNSVASLPPHRSHFTLSRVVFLLIFAFLLSLGQVLLASGVMENHGERFWVVSALIGSGYGAVFSLTPIIISVIWGVENFGTNWGIVAVVPALGATIWGLAYSTIYQRAAGYSWDGRNIYRDINNAVEDVLCYGKDCYASTFWAMAISVWIACAMWIWAWKGWSKRGIAV
jgi:MFS family permease